MLGPTCFFCPFFLLLLGRVCYVAAKAQCNGGSSTWGSYIPGQYAWKKEYSTCVICEQGASYTGSDCLAPGECGVQVPSYLSVPNCQQLSATGNVEVWGCCIKCRNGATYSQAQGECCLNGICAGSPSPPSSQATITACDARKGFYMDSSTGSCNQCLGRKYPDVGGYDLTTKNNAVTDQDYSGPLAKGCNTCQYPWYSIETPESPTARKQYWSCHPEFSEYGGGGFTMCLCAGESAVTAIAVVFSVFFAGTLYIFLWRSNRRFKISSDESTPHVEPLRSPVVLIGLSIYFILPMLDVLTDLIYLVSQPFFHYIIFFLFIFFYVVLSNIWFYLMLYNRNARPKMYLLAMPPYFVKPPEDYNTTWKVLKGAIITFPFVLVNSPVLIPQLIVGNLLYSSKLFALRRASLSWMDLWTGDSFTSGDNPRREAQLKLANEQPIDSRILNQSLYAHMLFESLPMIALLVTNATIAGGGALYNLDPSVIPSFVISVVNGSFTLYRIFYIKVVKKTSLFDTEIDLTVAGIDILGKTNREILLGKHELIPKELEAGDGQFTSLEKLEPSSREGDREGEGERHSVN